MNQQGQPIKPQNQPNVVQPPANLPGVDNIDSSSVQEPIQDNNFNVPERNVKYQKFPEEATKKIPSNPSVNKFGEPEDLIPKGLPITEEAEKSSSEQIPKTEEQVNEGDKQLTKDLTNKGSNNLKSNEYVGPSIENLERKSLIKKIIVLVIVGILLILSIVLAYNKWIKKPVVIDDQAEVTEKEPVIEEDIDEDGLPNEWEEKYGFDPKDSKDGGQDPDFDRLTNKKEYEYGTDPKKADTDGDGFKDGEEVQRGYNPNGSGKISENNNQANYFPIVKGKWQGTMTGTVYGSEVFETTLQSNGNTTGNLVYKILNTEDKSLECELEGMFTFKKETNVFTSKMNSKAGYKEGKKILTRGDFNLSLTGTLQDNKEELSGTWVLEPVTDIFWLKQDRGNFLLRKIADF
jgi:hypothetical protein